MQFLTTTSEGYISLFFTLALMLVLLYFMIYRPQKKQEKKDAAMRNSLEIGDQVTTIGGVIGRVVAIKDDTFVLETGADRVKIRFTKTAIGSVEKLNMDKAESTTINQTLATTANTDAAGQMSQANTATTFTVQATAMVVSMLPIMCVYPFLQKYFVQGMMIGAVKE